MSNTIQVRVPDIGDFEGTDGVIDPDTVIPGQSVRVFQVTTQSFVFVTGIIRELTPGVDYTAVASGGSERSEVLRSPAIHSSNRVTSVSASPQPSSAIHPC